jgi:hypothetical protein
MQNSFSISITPQSLSLPSFLASFLSLPSSSPSACFYLTNPQIHSSHYPTKTKTIWVLFLFSLLYSNQNFSHPIANKQEEEEIQQTTTTKQKTTQKGMHFTSNFFIHKKRLDSSDFYAGKQTQLSSPSHLTLASISLSLSLSYLSLSFCLCVMCVCVCVYLSLSLSLCLCDAICTYAKI